MKCKEINRYYCRCGLLRINKLIEQSVGAVCNRTSSGATQIVRLQTAPTSERFFSLIWLIFNKPHLRLLAQLQT